MRDEQQRIGRGRSVCPRVLVVGLLAAAGLVVLLARPTALVADDEASLRQRLDAAVERLTAEAAELDEFGEPAHQPVFDRPHPAIEGWGPEMAPLVLDRLRQSFTGNVYRDTYVRWHLMPPVKRLLEASFERFRETGEHTLPGGTSQQLVELARSLPAPVYHPYIPGEEATVAIGSVASETVRERLRELHRLRVASRVRIGIPPFEEVVSGAEAVPYVSEADRPRWQRMADRIEELRNQLRGDEGEESIRGLSREQARSYSERQKQIGRFNDRLRWMNRVVCDLYGEVIYLLIQSGDEGLLQLAVREIGRQLNNQQYYGLDLIEHMYFALLDGYMQLYEPESIRRMGRNLERIVRRMDSFDIYQFGSVKPPGRYHRGRRRNPADLAFHMVKVSQHPDMLATFTLDNSKSGGQGDDADESDATPTEQVDGAAHKLNETANGEPRQHFTGDDFTDDDVRDAMARAIMALRQPDDLLSDSKTVNRLKPWYMLDDVVRIGADGTRSWDRNEFGNHAVVAWAMLAAGESYQLPPLYRRINWVLSGDSPYTYDRGMRLQMLANMPSSDWQAWAHRDQVLLQRGLAETGNWPHRLDVESSGYWGDHASGLYGVLGMWAASLAGNSVDPNVWRLIDRHWRTTQQRTPDDEPAGWRYGMFNVEISVEERNLLANRPGADRVTGPMTAGGVVALALTERMLHGTRHAAHNEAGSSRELRKGIRWLEENFRLDDENAEDWFFYMWTLQRVGQITGVRTFNDVDWFRDVTAELLNRQQADGMWSDPAGRMSELMSTSFALLYLSSVNTPVAVAKLRFDGNWNNRPHDIWNFSEYASDWYEYATGWQIVDADTPLHHMIESPVMYLSTNDAFDFTDAEVDRLRAYIEAGGLLVVNQEPGGGAAFNTSLRRLRERLLPGHEFQALDDNHPLVSINTRPSGRTTVQAIANDIRPLVVYFNRDIGQGLQDNDVERSDSFSMLSNTYLYTMGLNPRRPRLEQYYVTRSNANPRRPVAAARIRHEGNYDPEPGALQQLGVLLANDHDVDLQVETVRSAELSEQRLAFLTASDAFKLSDDEVASLRQWVDNGGTLWVDAAGGSNEASRAMQQLIRRLAPGEVGRRLTAAEPIISGEGLAGGHDNRRVVYREYVLIRAGGITAPRLHAIYRDDRPAIIYSSEDLTAGLAGLGHWGIFGYSVDSARNLVVNGVLDVLRRE